MRACVPQPLLQLEECHRLPRVVELRCHSGAGAVTGDVAAHVGKRNTGFLAQSWDERLVQIGHTYSGEANEEEKIDQFSSLRIGEFYTLRTHLFPGGDGFADNPIYRLGEGGAGL